MYDKRFAFSVVMLARVSVENEVPSAKWCTLGAEAAQTTSDPELKKHIEALTMDFCGNETVKD